MLAIYHFIKVIVQNKGKKGEDGAQLRAWKSPVKS